MTAAEPTSSSSLLGPAISEAAHKDNLHGRILYVNCTYIATIGVSGLVICALGANLQDMAQIVQINTTKLGGYICFFRGCGSIIGSFLSPYIYENMKGDTMIFIGLLVMCPVLILVPSCWEAYQFYILYFILGLCAAINETGCTNLTRELRGKDAGPWLGANSISFGMSAAIVPLVESLSSILIIQYFFLAGLIFLVSGSVLYGIQLTKKSTEMNQLMSQGREENIRKSHVREQIDEQAPHYYVEYCVSFMLFCFIGGQVDMVVYIKNYIRLKDIVKNTVKCNVLTFFWLFVTLGRIIGLVDQRYITEDIVLIRHMTLCCILGSCSMLLVIIFPDNVTCFWLSIAGYALFLSPVIGYSRDLNNRLTLPTEKSIAKCSFGLNLGTSFVPFLTSTVWHWNHENPSTLMGVLFLSMFSPLPIIFLSKYLSYKETMPEPIFLWKREDSLYETDSVQTPTSKLKASVHAVVAVTKLRALTNSLEKIQEEDDNSSICDDFEIRNAMILSLLNNSTHVPKRHIDYNSIEAKEEII